MVTKGTNDTLPNNIGAKIIDPRKEFFIREKPSDPLFGPLTFQVANKQARDVSKDNDTGVMELITIVGSRPSDPNSITREFIVARYVRGKLTMRGRVAEFNSGR